MLLLPTLTAVLALPAQARTIPLSSSSNDLTHLPPLSPTGQVFDKRSLVHGIKTLSSPKTSEPVAATFDQQLDHTNTSLGTFKQRYWWDTQHWGGPGSPVFLMLGPESDAEQYLGYLSERSIAGMYAKRFRGAVILLEHRYFGNSIPFDRLDAETLQYLTVPNAIKDVTNFAKTAPLSIDSLTNTTTITALNAPTTPWVLIGGSYAGALAAWTSRIEPGVFAAYHASSAVVQPISDFWAYFDPIEKGLPRNCSADLKAVMGHVDEVLTRGNKTEVRDLKALFGLASVSRVEDFVEVLATPFYGWQGSKQQIHALCDAIELPPRTTTSRPPIVPGPSGVGLPLALQRFAAYIARNEAPSCSHPSSCDTYSPSLALSLSDSSIREDSDRQWKWLLCNGQLGWWLTGGAEASPQSLRPGIVSRLMTREHSEQKCGLMFPPVVGRDGRKYTVETHLGQVLGKGAGEVGWDAEFERVVFVDGELDPWRQAGVSSDLRPGGRRKSEASPEGMKVFVLDGALHCPDLVVDEIPEMNIVEELMQIMGEWLSRKALPGPARPPVALSNGVGCRLGTESACWGTVIRVLVPLILAYLVL